MHSGNTSTSYRALSSKTYVKLGEAAEAPFSPYYQCGLGQQHQVHKALGETGVWSSFTGLLATVTAEKASFLTMSQGVHFWLGAVPVWKLQYGGLRIVIYSSWQH